MIQAEASLLSWGTISVEVTFKACKMVAQSTLWCFFIPVTSHLLRSDLYRDIEERKGLFTLHVLFSQYKRILFLSFHNLCIYMHVRKMRFKGSVPLRIITRSVLAKHEMLSGEFSPCLCINYAYIRTSRK